MSADATAARPTRPGGALRTPEAVLVATGLAVHAANWAGSVLTGRLLGPAAFADLAVVTTILMLVVIASDAVQLVSVRSAATGRDADGLHAWVRGRATAAGVLCAFALVVGAPALAGVLRMDGAAPLTLFAVTVPLGLWLGAERGRAQGHLALTDLARSNALEAGIRLSLGVGLVVLGAGVAGATVAIPLGMLAALAPVRSRVRRPGPPGPQARRATRHSGTAVTIALLGQVMLTQADTLAVRTVVAPAEAGVFAAVALLGRGVFFLTTTLVEVAFPHMARGTDAAARTLTRQAVGATCGLGTAAVLLTALVPDVLLTAAFGSRFAAGEPLLWRYTLAASLGSVAWVAVTARIARGERRAAHTLVLAAVVQTVLVLVTAGTSLQRAVDVQVLVVAVLAALEVRPLLRPAAHPDHHTSHPGGTR